MEKLEVPDEPTHATISAYVPIGLRDRLNAAAKAGDTTASRWIARAIEERLERLTALTSKTGGSGSGDGSGADVQIAGASTSGSAGASAPRATRQAGASRSASSAEARKATVERHAAAAREANPIPKGTGK